MVQTIRQGSGNRIGNTLPVLWIVLLAAGLVASLMMLQGRIGFNVSDEGFLWYGTLRTSQGEVPLRDFQSYDVGRYYWCAAWSLLFGDGIIGLRWSAALFQIFGLTMGLLVARRVVAGFWTLVPVGLLLVVWMIPRHKVFESSCAMAAVFFAVWLMEVPSLTRHFLAGVFVGVAALMGLNHGVYNASAFLFIIVLSWWKGDRDRLSARLASWGVGILAGLSPMLVMMAIVPGFFDAYAGFIKGIFASGTNLPLPVPWPWNAPFGRVPSVDAAALLGVGFLFLITPIFCAWSLVLALISDRERFPSRTVLIAAGVVGAVYAHHAFSRADAPHLGQAVHPVLLGLIAIPASLGWKMTGRARLLTATLLAVGIMAGALLSPLCDIIKRPVRLVPAFLGIMVRDDRLRVHRPVADLIHCVEFTVATEIPRDAAVYVGPHMPGIYPILYRDCPVWESYALFSATPERQRRMIQSIEANHVKLAILADVPLDGRDELRFSRTHPMVWDHIMSEFEPLTIKCLPWNCRAFRRRVQPGG